jgi:hypothetical protein
MADLKRKGDLAELRVASDLRARGHKIAFPFGEDWDYDLIVEREGILERVQVKYTKSDASIVYVRCRSVSLTNGKVRQIKKYTAKTIDWIAVYDETTDRCYYVPAAELANGRDLLSLRLTATKNNQRSGVRFAEDYLGFPPPIATARIVEVEPAGFEPATSSVQATRSSS